MPTYTLDPDYTVSSVGELFIDSGRTLDLHRVLTESGDGMFNIADTDYAAIAALDRQPALNRTNLTSTTDAKFTMPLLALVGHSVTPGTALVRRADGLFEDKPLAGGGASLASTSVAGVSKLSVAPASSLNPIAAGINDPKLLADRAADVASIRTLGPGPLQAASGVHSHDVSALTATGTRNSETFLRGDNTWEVPAGSGTTTALTIPSAGLPTVTAVSAGEIYQHGANINTHVDYGTGGGRDPYQVAFPGMYDDGRSAWKTWGRYLLTGPNTTKLDWTQNDLTPQSPRALFIMHRSPLKWNDPNAFGNIQATYLARKYGIKLCAILPPNGYEGNVGNNFDSGQSGSLAYTSNYLAAQTILGDSFPACKPSVVFGALEGRNEPANDFASLSAHLKNISDFVRARNQWDDVPVVAPSVLDYYGILDWGDQRQIFGSRTRKFNGVSHPYFASWAPETRPDGSRSVYARTLGQAMAPQAPVWRTEDGVHDCETCDDFHPHFGCNAGVRASYTLRCLLESIKLLPRGSKIFWYELLDEFGTHNPADGEFYFGKVDTTTSPWTVKLVYWALRALLLIMDDGTRLAPLGDVQIPLLYSGALGSTMVLPCYWADGSWGAWFWDNRSIYDRAAHTNTSVAAYNITVTAPSTISAAKLGDPINNETTMSTLPISAGAVTFSCDARYPRVVKFT